MKNTKQGRPKGSKSTVGIRLKELTKYYTPHSVIMVGASWLENSGFKIKDCGLVELEKIRNTVDNTPIEVHEVDLS